MISADTKYIFRDGTLLLLEDNVVQVAFGIWNYRVLSIEFEPNWNAIMQKFIKSALTHDGISIRDLKDEYNLDEKQISELLDLFTRLQTDGFLYSRETVKQSIFGSYLLLGFGEIQSSNLNRDKYKEERPRSAILTNIPKLDEILSASQYDRWLDMTIVDLDTMPRVFQFDATQRTETTETLDFLNEHRKLSDYKAIVVILNYAHPVLLRNLNRIFLYYNIPWVFCTLDGPFVMLTTFIPEQTGCFECMEMRIMAQMRSMQDYKTFVSSLTQRIPSFKQIEFTPILQLPISVAMNELLLLSSINASHFVGRLLSIYFPLFEIQIQDLLRLPTCPACGNTSRATMKELYFDFRRFVIDFTDKFQTTKI